MFDRCENIKPSVVPSYFAPAPPPTSISTSEDNVNQRLTAWYFYFKLLFYSITELVFTVVTVVK